MPRERVQDNPINIRGDPLLEQAAKTALREYPQGEAGKLNKISFENWQKRLLLFSQVDNTVLKVNPNFFSPFKLEKGKPSPLGLFVESTFSERPDGLPIGKHALEYQYQHFRSAILSRIIFQDIGGRFYRDVDLKGIGRIYGNGISEGDDNREFYKVRVINPGRYRGPDNYEGLLDRDIAFYDYKMAETFLKKGIRTYRILGIIALQEVIAKKNFEGELAKTPEKLSLSEAVNEGILKKDFHPVVEVRAFGTKFRISDIVSCSQEWRQDPHGRLMLEDAKRLVSQELELKEPMSDLEYLEWFAKTLGYNIGLMHRNGFEHHFLGDGHNITLDCRIVDLDSVRRLENDSARKTEFRRVEELLTHMFLWSVKYKWTSEEKRRLRSIFLENYEAAFNSSPKT